MINPFYIDWLRRFREDLRVGDMNSLTQNVQLAGLEVLLDPEFLALACQEDARSVVVLIATLGIANSEQPAPYQRLLAAYQYLQNQIGLQDAAERCSTASKSSLRYYVMVLAAAKDRAAIYNINRYVTHSDDLHFGIQFLVNTGQSHAIQALLIAWQTVDRSDLPWLRTCRTIASRSLKVKARKEAAELATTIQWLLNRAPSNQTAVIQEMRVQCAKLALKSRQGSLACRAAKDVLAYDAQAEHQLTYAKALVLAGNSTEAMWHLNELLLNVIRDGYVSETKKLDADLGVSPYTMLRAEDALVDINRLLRAKGLKPFLISGTLLGYVRQNSLLPNDKDIDLGLIGWESQFTVAEALLEAGHYKLDLTELGGKNSYLISAYDLRQDIPVDLFLFHEKGDHFLHGIDFEIGFTQNFRFSKFELEEVDFLDERFYVPSDIDRNLTENYGDWRTPVPSYVVTVESPALCDTPDTRTLLVYLEILQTIAKGLNPKRVLRILNHLENTNNLILSTYIREQLHDWCDRQISRSSFDTKVAV